MRLLFLGTAAAEGYPGIFCNCAFCREARALGGRNLRYRSALLVNDDLLIDFGPDLLASALRFNLGLWAVRTGLVTHAHSDHFYPGNFEMRAKSFTGGQQIPLLKLFGPQEVAAVLSDTYTDLAALHLETQTVHAFDRWENNGYKFSAFHAYHAVGNLEALFYSVDDGQHAFLYATDTGSFPEDTWQA
ncbi:MAG: metal-dependent hydrolase, partial [Anaerolineaceae bacterium]|nr:metal-dependent hydrolase [Anaerolineaceae bacterium]